MDQVARILAAQLSTQTGQQFIVENRTGASGAIGTQAVATAPPDGYTWGVVFAPHAVNPALMQNLAYDTLKDLTSVMLIGTSPMAIVAHRDQPFKDFRDVLAAAKKSPVAIGSIGTGSLGHLAIAQGVEIRADIALSDDHLAGAVGDPRGSEPAPRRARPARPFSLGKPILRRQGQRI